MTARLLGALGAVILLVTTASIPQARAQGPSREVAQRAMGHYRTGVSAYRGGRYDDAIAAFNRAYEIDPAPILVFNLAQAHWKKGDRQAALEAYQRYLVLDPGAPNRAQVESRIRELSPPAAPPVAAPVEPAPAPAPIVVEPVRPVPLALQPPPQLTPAPVVATTPAAREEERPPLYRRGWFWTAVGAVAVGAAVAVVLSARSSGGDNWSCADCNWSGARVR